MKCKELRMASRWRGPGLIAMTAFLALMTSMSLSATPVATGVANIDGTVLVNTSGVFFFNNSNVANQFNAAPSTGSYSGLTGGTIDNLTGPPVTGPVSIIDFATFNATIGTINFDLTNIFAGVGTNAACGSNTVGNVCTPTGSPFTLTQTNTGVTVTLALSGVAYVGTSATGSTPTNGLFTAQVIVPGTITSVLSEVGSSTLPLQTYSATFASTAVPEPATSGLIGAALLGLGLLRTRRIRS